MSYKSPSAELPIPEHCTELVRGTIFRQHSASWLVGGKPSKLADVTHIISHYEGCDCVCYRDKQGLLHIEVAILRGHAKHPLLTDLGSKQAKQAKANQTRRWRKDAKRTTKYRMAFRQQQVTKSDRRLQKVTKGYTTSGGQMEDIKLERRPAAPLPAFLDDHPEWQSK